MRHRKGSQLEAPRVAAPAPYRPEAAKPADMGVHAGGARLGEMLVRENLVTQEQVVAALEAAKQPGRA